MVLWLSLFDVIIASTTVMRPLGTITDETENQLPFLCKAQAACIQFGIYANLLWTLCFGVHLLRIVKKKTFVFFCLGFVLRICVIVNSFSCLVTNK